MEVKKLGVLKVEIIAISPQCATCRTIFMMIERNRCQIRAVRLKKTVDSAAHKFAIELFQMKEQKGLKRHKKPLYMELIFNLLIKWNFTNQWYKTWKQINQNISKMDHGKHLFLIWWVSQRFEILDIKFSHYVLRTTYNHAVALYVYNSAE